MAQVFSECIIAPRKPRPEYSLDTCITTKAATGVEWILRATTGEKMNDKTIQSQADKNVYFRHRNTHTLLSGSVARKIMVNVIQHE